MMKIKQNKSLIFGTVIIIIVVLCIVNYFLFISKEDSSIIKNTESENNNLFYFGSNKTTEGGLLFYSDYYKFSFNTESNFSYSEYTPMDSALNSYLFSRINNNTSEESNRDTPNGFNTSADDRMLVSVYSNEQGLISGNIDVFQLWLETISPGKDINGFLSVYNFSNTSAIEAVTVEGINSFSQSLYFFSEDYIIEISSPDVPKDELYNIANSFKWIDSDVDNKKIDKDIFNFQTGSENDKLIFPEAQLSLEVPNGLLTFIEEEVDRYNDADINNEYYLWRACRLISKKTSKDFILWVSFDEYDKLCGTERTAASVSESEYQNYGDDFCSNLESADRFPFQQYYGCEESTNVPSGFVGYSYYEFIQDYGIEDSGYIIKEVYLENKTEEERKIIVGYIPNNESILNIKPSEFTDYVELIQNGEYEIFNSTNENMQIFDEIVSSLTAI